MNEKKREIRSIECELSIREDANAASGEPSRTIVGRAIVFNTESEVLDDWGMRFREIISPEAVTEEFLRTQDVKMNQLHDRTLTIARCKFGARDSSLRLSVDESGVNFEFEAPKCDIGDRALALVRSGVYSGCSFEFYPQDYDIEELDDETVRITHRKFKALTALTIGMDPAYTSTTVNARELYDGTPKGKAEKEKREKEEEEKKKQGGQPGPEDILKRETERRLDVLRGLENLTESEY